MKTLHIAALAFAFAMPAAAQSLAQPQTYQGHAQHQTHQHAATPQAADHAAHAQHQGHDRSGVDHSKHANCCGDANGNGKMDCCEGGEAAQRPCCAGHVQGDRAQPDRPAQPQNR